MQNTREICSGPGGIYFEVETTRATATRSCKAWRALVGRRCDPSYPHEFLTVSAKQNDWARSRCAGFQLEVGPSWRMTLANGGVVIMLFHDIFSGKGLAAGWVQAEPSDRVVRQRVTFRLRFPAPHGITLLSFIIRERTPPLEITLTLLVMCWRNDIINRQVPLFQVEPLPFCDKGLARLKTYLVWCTTWNVRNWSRTLFGRPFGFVWIRGLGPTGVLNMLP